MSKYWLLIGQSDSFIRTDNTYAHNAKRLRKLLLILSSRLILELILLFNCFILINKMPGSNLNFFEMTWILSVSKQVRLPHEMSIYDQWKPVYNKIYLSPF